MLLQHTSRPPRHFRASAAGQLLQEQRAYLTADQANYASYSYSPNGLRTSVTDANGNRAELIYDGFDRLARWIFPSPTNVGLANPLDYEEYGYDDAGNRTSLRKRDGSVLGFQYDALDRMTARIVPERAGLTAAQTRDVHYGYDLGNRQLFARFDSPSGEGITNAWDGFGRQLSSSTSMGGVTRTLSYSYDAAGNRTSITHPDNIWFGMWYDALGRQYYLHANNALGLVYMYFAPHGGISAIGRPGIASWINYDSVQRPQTLSHLAYTPAATDVAFSFGRNRAGQITSIVRDNDSYAWAGHYGATRAYATNGLNQYTAIDSTTAAGPGHASYSFDPNGNLTSDGSNSYVYDVENRLVSASGAHNAALVYDPLGRLFQVTGGASTTRFLYDGDALVAEYDGSNHMTRRHVHWTGADVPVATFDVPPEGGLGTLRNLFADQQGSIIAQGDGTGAITAINRYDEYGIPAATNTGRFQYTGQAWLPELGLYHYKARAYSPTLGRFMQTDPIGYDDQINLYEYVGDDPINRTDPTGLYVCTGNKEQCHGLALSLKIVRAASQSENLSRADRAVLRRISIFYGRAGMRNGVAALFRPQRVIAGMAGGRETSGALTIRVPSGAIGVILPDNFATMFNDIPGSPTGIGRPNFSPVIQRANLVAHEGQHGADIRQAGGYLLRPEPPAYHAGNLVNRAFGADSTDN